jgi:hypothetical protein
MPDGFFNPILVRGLDKSEAFMDNDLRAKPWNKGCFQKAANLKIE